MTPEAEAFFHSLAPDGCIPTQMIAILCWVDPTTGAEHWEWLVALDSTIRNDLGMLEMTKFEMIRRSEQEAE